jgi:hypothetical protein
MFKPFAFLLAPTLLLTACHDDSSQATAEALIEARFSTATDEQRRQMVSAALGDHAEELLILPLVLFPDEKQACPARAAQDEKNYTLTGGCTAGTLRVEGAIAVADAEPSTSIRWDHFAVRDEAKGAATSIDGSYVITTEGKGERRDVDVRFEGSSPTGRIALDTRLDLKCEDFQSKCHAEPGSSVTLDGVGSADISLAYEKPSGRESRQGVLELTGAETLRYEMKSTSRDDDNRLCGPITIDGKDAGKLCLTR